MSSDEEITADEWDLDDAQEELVEVQGAESTSNNNQALLANALQPTPSLPTARLQYPVILPQRRPKRRHRGFIRAYAPDLLACGIDQQTFIAFLDELDKSTAWSPLVEVINLSTIATVAIPGGIGAAVSIPIQIATGIYKELQGRKGQNEFLHKMNAEMFRPRGLYCLIVAYSPSAKEQVTQENIAAAVGTRTEASTATFGDRFKNNFRNSDGSFGSLEFPTSAELIFPGLETAPGDGPKKSGFARVMERYGARRDRKRTAKWIRKNPASPLEALMDPMAAELAKEKGLKKPKKRRLARNLLYMMIVNMPSDDEMAEALRVTTGSA
ncbi:hypothetical protein F5B22DRAFT_660160 [Xylaria bambusicola]|uniref:uncharacterized protein n=1 Tax=Xylaria bambusicola TaxID=326684 RepID=UPI002007AB2E|nr:uncharacterized protein F5B22DRAFT_660160 [Xylaria bambusicola]KAI0506612.1 hypothetical protein F5B22DRAFT_660160 [Xylaria bambusicola]